MCWEGDYVQNLFSCSEEDWILLFCSFITCYSIVYFYIAKGDGAFVHFFPQFSHLYPKWALVECFSPYFLGLFQQRKFHTEEQCCAMEVLGFYQASRLTRCCWRGKMLPFCRLREMKRVTQQKALWAHCNLMVEVLCQHFSFPAFLEQFALCHYPVKLYLKYNVEVVMSNVE